MNCKHRRARGRLENAMAREVVWRDHLIRAASSQLDFAALVEGPGDDAHVRTQRFRRHRDVEVVGVRR